MACARWAVILVPLAAVVGTLCAAFLWSLDVATKARFSHPWLLFLLPVGGFAIGLLYHRVGRSVEGGNNLIVDQIHEPGGGVPLRMAPLIFLGTVVTHLFGGSAGREGTAVQLGWQPRQRHRAAGEARSGGHPHRADGRRGRRVRGGVRHPYRRSRLRS